jgi:release factor glutamine methyltransferase
LNKIDAKFVVSDLFSNINGKFNTIIFNPPYLPSDDKKHLAYDGGKSGRDLINRFMNSYKSKVAEDHVVLLLESSFNDYGKDVKKLKAKVVAKEHYFFEDLVVLLFE